MTATEHTPLMFRISDVVKLTGLSRSVIYEQIRAGRLRTVKQGSATLITAAPELFVADIKASCDFFTQKLGFSTVFVYGEPPFYGQVRRDKALLNLRLVCEPVYAGDIREREQLLAASMAVDSAAELKQLFLQYQAAGVAFGSLR